MGSADVLMAGRASAGDLAAVSVGTSIWLPLLLFMIGTLMGLTPIVARHVGARRFAAIRPVVQQGLWIALALGGGCSLGVWFLAPALFALMAVPDAVAALAVRYVHAVALGLPAIALYETLRFYSDGMHHTRASLQFALLGSAVNVVANYVLIYGGAGLAAVFGSALPATLRGVPALGAAGCGIATAVSMGVMCSAMFVYTRRASVYRLARVGVGFSAPSPAGIAELLRVGLPIGVAIFSEVSLFSVIALFLAGLGKVVIAAHTVALNFSSILFMVPLSLGLALTVRVGHTLGKQQLRRARFVAVNGVACGLIAAFLIDLVLVFGGAWGVSLYTGNAEVRDLAARLLLLATLYQFSDALQVCIAGALRGYQDTRFIMAATLVSYWGVGMGAGYLLGRGIPGVFAGLGVYGYWIGLIAGLSSAAALLGWRLNRVTRITRLPASGPPWSL